MADRFLQLWWDDFRIGRIEAKRPWDLRLRFSPGAQERWPTNARPVSCSVPVQRRPVDANAFLKGLLPEGNHLQALAGLAGVSTNDAFGLLRRYGRDVAGALTILEGDEEPSDARWAVEPYDDRSFAEELIGLDDGSLGVRPDSELSIAGLQNKILLVELPDGGWGRPVGGRPSTHLLKVDDPRFPGLVAVEGACLRLARSVGLGDLDPRLGRAGPIDWLIVRRYDRIRTSEGGLLRRHQEDACQALGIDPQGDRARAKYEVHGGPSWASIAGLLRMHSRLPDDDLRRLLAVVVFTSLIGNADAHGRNLSFLHDPDGGITLAPIYDTVPTMLWPNLRRTAAMAVAGVRDFDGIGMTELVAEATVWGVARAEAAAVVVELVERAIAAVPDAVDHPELAAAIIERGEALLS